ncbi:MAG: hypothetical protein EBU59_09745 [Planctomycetia bacterium]|nr:hypothetical protein [Planctomycetia bacterium]
MTHRDECRKDQGKIVTANTLATASTLQKRSDGQAGPVQPEGKGRSWWLVATSSVLGLLFLSWLVVTRPPDFYRAVAGTTPERSGAAGRFVTSIAAIASASQQEGTWGVEMKEHEINAWLEQDLPRNHPHLLAGSAWGRLSRPRIQLEPHLARIGIEVTTWGVTAVAWAEIEVRLRAANQLAVSVHRAGLGSLPLPRDAVLRECGRRLSKAGLETQMQRFRDRSLLLATIPQRLAEQPAANSAKPKQPTQRWQVESLRIDRGSLTVAGSSRQLQPLRRSERMAP